MPRRKKAPKGLYLFLFNGRKTPDEQLDDWGEQGSLLGPFKYVHTTYATDIKVESLAGRPQVLTIIGDCLQWNGWYYGDWSVINEDVVNNDPELFKRWNGPTL